MAKKKWYRFPIYLLARGTASLIGRLPRKGLLLLTAGFGELGFFLVERQREKTLRHLRLAYGREKSEKEIRRIARGVFRNMALNLAELLVFPHLTAEKVCRFVDMGDGLKRYQEVLKENKGMIAITAHIGNWDLLAGVFGLQGFQGAALGRRIYYEPYNAWIVGLRQAVGVQTIYRDTAGREMMQRLKNNEVIGILPDQDMDSLKGIYVEYFGLPAYTTIAPVRLSIASGAPILVNFLIRVGLFRYKVVTGSVFKPAEDPDRKGAVEKYTRLWMQEFEAMVRQYPEQWGWMHDRWKTQAEKTEKIREENKINV